MAGSEWFEERVLKKFDSSKLIGHAKMNEIEYTTMEGIEETQRLRGDNIRLNTHHPT